MRLYEVNNLPEPNKDTPSIERCCWLLTHLFDLNSEPSEEVIGEFGEIVEAAKIAGFNKNKKRQYKMGMDYEKLQRAILNERVQEATEKGKEEGKKESAKNLLALGVDINTISQATGLTPEEIQSLS